MKTPLLNEAWIALYLALVFTLALGLHRSILRLIEARA